MPTKDEYQELAKDAGWKMDEQGNDLRFQPKSGRALVIAKDISETPGVTKHIETVPVERLTVDHQFQRPLDEHWTNHLATNWDFGAVGILTVSQRPDGTMVLLDGQHRREALTRLGGKCDIDCLVYKGLTMATEASLFNKLNSRLNVHPIVRYHARLLAREPNEVAVEGILNQYGMKWSWSTHTGYPCVGALLKTYGYGYEVLRDVIEVLEASWPQDHNRHTPLVVNAMAQFRRHAEAFNIDRAIKKYEPIPLKSLMVAAKSDSIGTDKGVYWWLARRFQLTYRKGLRQS